MLARGSEEAFGLDLRQVKSRQFPYHQLIAYFASSCLGQELVTFALALDLVLSVAAGEEIRCLRKRNQLAFCSDLPGSLTRAGDDHVIFHELQELINPPSDDLKRCQSRFV